MAYENIELNNLSEEQSLEKQERQKKFAELVDTMADFSFADSNEAYEESILINDFMDKFDNKKENKEKGLKLKDYLLGGILLRGEDIYSETNYSAFDTEDGEIESFIVELYKQQLEKKQNLQEAAA